MTGLAKLIASIQAFGTIIWLVIGAVYRWGFVGKVCSGDNVVDGNIQAVPYAAETGKFMKYYLMIVFGIIGVGLCCGIIAGVSLGASTARA